MKEEEKTTSKQDPSQQSDRHPQEGTLYLVAIGAAVVIFIIFLISMRYNRSNIRNEATSDAAGQLFQGIETFFTTGIESAQEISDQDQQ